MAVPGCCWRLARRVRLFPPAVCPKPASSDRTGLLALVLLTLAGAAPERDHRGLLPSHDRMQQRYAEIGAPDQLTAVRELPAGYNAIIEASLTSTIASLRMPGFLLENGLPDTELTALRTGFDCLKNRPGGEEPWYRSHESRCSGRSPPERVKITYGAAKDIWARPPTGPGGFPRTLSKSPCSRIYSWGHTCRRGAGWPVSGPRLACCLRLGWS